MTSQHVPSNVAHVVCAPYLATRGCGALCGVAAYVLRLPRAYDSRSYGPTVGGQSGNPQSERLQLMRLRTACGEGVVYVTSCCSYEPIA